MTSATWSFDETAHAGIEHLDPATVAIYGSKAHLDPAADVTLLQGLGLGSESTLIDLGAGTGTFAFAVAPLCRRVVAVDISPPMIEMLTEGSRVHGTGNVEIVRAGFLTYEHTGEPADFVYCRNALHHLPDFWKAIALQRMAALLRPGGILRLRDLVYSFDPVDAEEVMAAWLRRAPERPEDGWTRSELEAHIGHEFSTFSWLLEPMLQRAGFEIRQADHAARIYARYVCARPSSAGD